MFPRMLKLIESNSFFIFGARGTGKTTLLEHNFSAENSFVLDLLDSDLYADLQDKPSSLKQIVKQKRKEWCIIDEVQKVPEILDIVHSLIEKEKQKFILTGSSARKLKRGASNLLAGRAFVFSLFPLTHVELDSTFDLNQVLSYGSLPKVFGLKTEREKKLFLKAYADTYLKEEILIEQLIRKLPPFRKFLEISAKQDTDLVSYSNIGRDILSDAKVVKNYYTILEDTLLGFFLQPYHTSLRKRQKKSPKFYWFDCGVRRVLSGNLDYEITPKSYEYGSLFESFVVNEIFRLLTYQEKSFDLSFIRLDDDIEVDLILERAGLPSCLIEIKSTDRINESHLKSINTVKSLIKNSKAYVFSNDSIPKLIGDVTCLHWSEGLKEIGVLK